jgi:hypothetical protein
VLKKSKLVTAYENMRYIGARYCRNAVLSGCARFVG